MNQTTTLLDGLCFGEGPRWHNNKLWFSDMHAHQVCTVDMAGNKEVILDVPEQPSGLGWMPDGSLLVVSMVDRKLLKITGGNVSEHAHLGSIATHHCNDMVVDSEGRAYVGHFGSDIEKGQSPDPAHLILVAPDGSVTMAADEMNFPNGTVITPDNRTLIVGESFGGRLTAFDIGPNGELANRRIWAQLEGAVPDGICLDEAGGIWVASPVSHEALRVLEGGEVTDRVKIDTQAYACMLGGEDGKRLFILTSSTSDPGTCKERRDGKIEYVDVDHARAGRP